MRNKFILGMSVLFLSLPFLKCFEKEENANSQLLIRENDYSEVVFNSSFRGFNDVVKEEDDSNIIYHGTKSFDSSIFKGLDLTGIRIINGTNQTLPKTPIKKLDVEFVGIVKKRERIIDIKANFKNFALKLESQNKELSSIESLEGFVTYNNRGELDVLFATKDEDTWLSEIKDSKLDNAGFWDWLKSIAQAVVDTVENIVEEIIETAEEIVESFVEFVEGVASEAIDYLTNVAGEINSAIVEEVTSALEAIVGYTINSVINTYEDLRNYINTLPDGPIKDLLSKITENPIQNVSNLLANNQNWFTDFTANGIRALIEGITLNGGTLDYWAQFLCMYQEVENGIGNGIYHAKQDCWQKAAGYNDIYDAFFHLGSNMDALSFSFYDTEDDNDDLYDYVLWAWKGDYWALGCGGELGIYRRLNDSEHFVMDYSLAMDMAMKVYYKGIDDPIIDWHDTEKNWWMTSFNSNYKTTLFSEEVILPEDIEIDYQIIFNPSIEDKALLNEIKESFETKNIDHGDWVKIDEATYTFKWEAKNGWKH